MKRTFMRNKKENKSKMEIPETKQMYNAYCQVCEGLIGKFPATTVVKYHRGCRKDRHRK